MVNDDGHVLNFNYTMLPDLLKTAGYTSHAIGKDQNAIQNALSSLILS